MTAIAAAFGADARSAAAGVRLMLDAAPHRGAQAPVTWSGGAAILGHRASAGRDGVAQSPFAADAGGHVVVFDGRLDNGSDLCRALSLASPLTDAALVLAAYAQWPDDAPAHLLGDFAFILWDAGRQRLVCARDAMGQRSLFYGAAAGVTLIASEPQQILAYPAFPAVVNEGAIAEHLTGNPATIDETIWTGVIRLAPAHTLIVSQGAHRRSRYWGFDPDACLTYPREEEYAERFLDLVRTAIECRTRGATSVGVFLSGGLDSSAVAGLAEFLGRQRGAAPLRALSLTFPGTALDETPYIDAVVQKWDLPSVRLVGRAATREEIERDVALYRDVPTYPNGSVLDPLRRVAAAEVDVALDGAGGDDWFTGSPLHTADLLREGRVLAAVRQYRADIALPGRGYTRAGLLRAAIGPLLPSTARAVIRPFAGARQPSFDWIRPEFATRVGLAERLRWPRPPVCRTLVQAQIHQLANCLPQLLGDELEDRATSAAGLDQRHPLNDRRLAEFGFALPESQRWSGGETKVLMRRAFASVLPEPVRQRRDKADFSPTFVDALACLGGRSFFERLRVAEAGWVDGPVTRRMYDRMMALYTRGHAAYIPLVAALWSVAAVELWLNHQQKERRQ